MVERYGLEYEEFEGFVSAYSIPRGTHIKAHIISSCSSASPDMVHMTSPSDSTGVGDSIVNQLLSKIDGVDSLNNILIIGMTNRYCELTLALPRPFYSRIWSWTTS